MTERSERKKFDREYEKKISELIVLTSGMGGGAGKSGGHLLWQPSQTLIGYVDCATGTLIEREGRLEWLADESEKEGWIFNLKPKEIYRIKARKKKSGRPEEYQDLIKKGALTAVPTFEDYFMLVEVVERSVEHSGLQEVLCNYEKPVILNTAQGKFELNRELHYFEGSISWGEAEPQVYLNVGKEKEAMPEAGLRTLDVLTTSCSEWDHKFRAYAAEELTELANDWQESSDGAITESDFQQRLKISELAIDKAGDFEVYYDDDEMFWGHVIIVEGNISQGLSSAYIAG